MIDLFLTNDKKLFRDVKALPSASFDSDHRLVLATLNLKAPKRRPKMARIRYKIEKLYNADFAKDFRAKVKANLEMEREEARWSTLKNAVKKGAEEALGVRKSYGGKKNNPMVEKKCSRQCKNEYEEI